MSNKKNNNIIKNNVVNNQKNSKNIKNKINSIIPIFNIGNNINIYSKKK